MGLRGKLKLGPAPESDGLMSRRYIAVLPLLPPLRAAPVSAAFSARTMALQMGALLLLFHCGNYCGIVGGRRGGWFLYFQDLFYAALVSDNFDEYHCCLTAVLIYL